MYWKLSITCAGAVLMYLNVYPYAEMGEKGAARIRSEVEKIWKEYQYYENDELDPVKDSVRRNF